MPDLSLKGMDREGREKVLLLPPTLYILPQEVGKTPGLQTVNYLLLNLRVNMCLFNNLLKPP